MDNLEKKRAIKERGKKTTCLPGSMYFSFKNSQNSVYFVRMPLSNIEIVG